LPGNKAVVAWILFTGHCKNNWYNGGFYQFLPYFCRPKKIFSFLYISHTAQKVASCEARQQGVTIYKLLNAKSKNKLKRQEALQSDWNRINQFPETIQTPHLNKKINQTQAGHEAGRYGSSYPTGICDAFIKAQGISLIDFIFQFKKFKKIKICHVQKMQ